MTRFATLGGLTLILAVSGPAPADDKKDVPKELVPFQGTWTVVEASFAGMKADKAPKLTFAFEGTKMTVTESGDKPDVGSFTVDSKKEPAQIDMVSPAGEKIPGIYKFDKNGRLTIAFERGKAARPKSFDDKEAVVIVLEKTKQ